MGTTREHYIVLFTAAGSIGLVAGVIGSWLGAFFGARRAVRSARSNSPTPNDAARAQMTELAQMVEAIAIEVERVSEGQRFTTRRLADRVPLAPSVDVRPRAPDHITPH